MIRGLSWKSGKRLQSRGAWRLQSSGTSALRFHSLEAIIISITVALVFFILSHLDFNNRVEETHEPVHVINIEIQDNHDEATLGAFLIYELCQLVRTWGKIMLFVFLCSLFVCLFCFVLFGFLMLLLLLLFFVCLFVYFSLHLPHLYNSIVIPWLGNCL